MSLAEDLLKWEVDRPRPKATRIVNLSSSGLTQMMDDKESIMPSFQDRMMEGYAEHLRKKWATYGDPANMKLVGVGTCLDYDEA